MSIGWFERFGRNILCVVVLAVVTGTVLAQSLHSGKQHHLVTYVEQGDPGAPLSKITVDLDKLHTLLAEPLFRRKGPYKERRSLALRMLKVAERYVNKNTKDDPDQILEMLHVFGQDDISTSFCAIGIYYSACQAYCELNPQRQFINNVIPTFKDVLKDVNKYYFTPDPFVPYLVKASHERKIWAGRSQVPWPKVKPGWLVILNWGGNVLDTSYPQHVGLVESATAQGLATIEFNTSDPDRNLKVGAIKRKVRPYRWVVGYVRLY